MSPSVWRYNGTPIETLLSKSTIARYRLRKDGGNDHNNLAHETEHVVKLNDTLPDN